MTFAIGHVSGGTNAGRKRQLPAPVPWRCLCVDWDGRCYEVDWAVHDDNCACLDDEECAYWMSRRQPAHMSRCLDCGMVRPR